MNLFFENYVFTMPLVFIVFLKMIKVLLLYAFAIFIAPFGIVYVSLVNKTR